MMRLILSILGISSCLAAFRHPSPPVISTTSEMSLACRSHSPCPNGSSPEEKLRSCQVKTLDTVTGTRCWSSGAGKILPIPLRPSCNPPIKTTISKPVTIVLWKFDLSIIKISCWTCSKVETRNKCVKWFFGAESKETSSSSLSISQTECESLLASPSVTWNKVKTHGTIDNNPGFSCPWTGTTTNYRTITTITRTSGIVEPTSSRISGNFPLLGACVYPIKSCPGPNLEITVFDAPLFPGWPPKCALLVSSTAPGVAEYSPDHNSDSWFVTSSPLKMRFSLPRSNLTAKKGCYGGGALLHNIYPTLDGYLLSFTDKAGKTLDPPKFPEPSPSPPSSSPPREPLAVMPRAPGTSLFRNKRSAKKLPEDTLISQFLDHLESHRRVKRSAPGMSHYSNPLEYISKDNIQNEYSRAELEWAMDHLEGLTATALTNQAHQDCIAAGQRWDIAWGLRFTSPEVSISIWTGGTGWAGRIIGSHLEVWPCYTTPALSWCKPIESCAGFTPVAWVEDDAYHFGWMEGVSGMIFRNGTSLVCGVGQENTAWIPINSTHALDLYSGDHLLIKNHFYDGSSLDSLRDVFTSAPMYDHLELGGVHNTLEAISIMQEGLEAIRGTMNIQQDQGSITTNGLKGISPPNPTDWITSLFGPIVSPFIRILFDIVVVGTVIWVVYLLIKVCMKHHPRSSSPRQNRAQDGKSIAWKI